MNQSTSSLPATTNENTGLRQQTMKKQYQRNIPWVRRKQVGYCPGQTPWIGSNIEFARSIKVQALPCYVSDQTDLQPTKPRKLDNNLTNVTFHLFESSAMASSV